MSQRVVSDSGSVPLPLGAVVHEACWQVMDKFAERGVTRRGWKRTCKSAEKEEARLRLLHPVIIKNDGPVLTDIALSLQPLVGLMLANPKEADDIVSQFTDALAHV